MTLSMVNDCNKVHMTATWQPPQQPQPLATACLISHRVASGGCRKLSIMHDWEQLPHFGAELFNILTEVLPGYAKILKARKELSDSMDVDPPPAEPTGTGGRESSNMDVDLPALPPI
ncbi:hypothetical protein B0H13DRAFT_2287985 [Mycena leptocephala]|nr:hypothetical protein B0H13DRAFT_2287985 [Mycena leptocephala]